jgi:hypothetical protein
MAKNDFQTGTRAVRPETPAVGRSVQRRGGCGILEGKKGLRPAG